MNIQIDPGIIYNPAPVISHTHLNFYIWYNFQKKILLFKFEIIYIFICENDIEITKYNSFLN